jgi:hypothetical protein
MFKKPTGSSCKAVNAGLIAAALTQNENRGLVTKASSYVAPLGYETMHSTSERPILLLQSPSVLCFVLPLCAPVLHVDLLSSRISIK